jgi:hypothetical protein
MPETLASLLREYLAMWQANPEGVSLPESQGPSVFAELHRSEEALPYFGWIVDSAVRLPCLPALPRELAHGRRCESESRTGTDAAFTWDIWLRDWRRTTRAVDKMGDASSGREVLRPDARKLRMKGEYI